ncbi:MAG: hypothetical protein VB062_08165 [Christensenella sp.]|nr:hypothetical protein [Christensenella sp.]
MDTPVGLSPILVNEIFSMIGQLHNSGITILLVEQARRRRLRLRIAPVCPKQARISMQGSAKELAGDDRVRKAYLGA